MLTFLDPSDASHHLASLSRTGRSDLAPAADLRPVRRHRHPLAFLARALTTGPGTLTAPTLAFG
jgi:hypothetical protein